MKKEAEGRGAAAAICNRQGPSEHFLRHLEGFRIGNEEEDECGVEGVFGLEGEIRRGRRGVLASHSVLSLEDLRSPRARPRCYTAYYHLIPHLLARSLYYLHLPPYRAQSSNSF